MLRYIFDHLKWPLFSCIFGLAFWGCGKQENEPVQVSRVPESFQFMNIGANTIIDSEVRNRLRANLGSDAGDRNSTIDMELKYDGFLKAYYPDLANLNQRLNVNDVVRKEYPATKLAFRNTQRRSALFDYVELIFDHTSGCPLLIKMIAKKEISELIEAIKDKYGPPKRIALLDGKSWSLSWRKNNDVFVIARIIGRNNQAQYHMMIVYTNRLEQLLARSGNEEQQRVKPNKLF